MLNMQGSLLLPPAPTPFLKAHRPVRWKARRIPCGSFNIETKASPATLSRIVISYIFFGCAYRDIFFHTHTPTNVARPPALEILGTANWSRRDLQFVSSLWLVPGCPSTGEERPCNLRPRPCSASHGPQSTVGTSDVGQRLPLTRES